MLCDWSQLKRDLYSLWTVLVEGRMTVNKILMVCEDAVKVVYENWCSNG